MRIDLRPTADCRLLFSQYFGIMTTIQLRIGVRFARDNTFWCGYYSKEEGLFFKKISETLTSNLKRRSSLFFYIAFASTIAGVLISIIHGICGYVHIGTDLPEQAIAMVINRYFVTCAVYVMQTINITTINYRFITMAISALLIATLYYAGATWQRKAIGIFKIIMIAIMLIASAILPISVFLFAYLLEPTYTIASSLALLFFSFVLPVIMNKYPGGTKSSAARRFYRICLAMILVNTCAIVFIKLNAYREKSISELNTEYRYIHAPVYNVAVAGSPKKLFVSNQNEFFYYSDPYGSKSGKKIILKSRTVAERLLVDADGNALFLAVSSSGVMSFKLDPPKFMREYISSSGRWPAYLAVDGNHLFVLSEWNSMLTIFDIRSGKVIREIHLSPNYWQVPVMITDTMGRKAYISSLTQNGTVYEMNLDTFRITRKLPRIFAYGMALDKKSNCLWSVRPIPGDIACIDIATFRIKRKLRVKPGVRDIAYDEKTGVLFTVSYMDGELRKIDTGTWRLLKTYHVGKRCRNLFLDTDRGVLWVSSSQGVFRIPAE
jgi:hypothetical protein